MKKLWQMLSCRLAGKALGSAGTAKAAGSPVCELQKALGRAVFPLAAAVLLAAAFTAGAAFPSWALDAGTYLVTMSPSYRDPETGSVEDPGNNEAIGQGMTEKLCGPTGLLEVDAGGSMYLTVRYYLSQFVTDVSFEERTGGSYHTLSYEKMQTKAPVDGSSNIDEKYGFTDYRMPVSGTGSVFRGKAYIEPMGRSVVYFFTFSNPVPGSGDFVTSTAQQTVAPETEAEILEEDAVSQEYAAASADAYEGENGADDAYRFSPEADEADSSGLYRRAESGASEALTAGGGAADEDGADVLADAANGSGNADDPVTGIPQKPSALSAKNSGTSRSSTGSGNTGKTGGNSAADTAGEYHLDTKYDLSAVSVKEARRLTEPMLQEAVGITGMTGDAASETGNAGAKLTGNRLVMTVLLAAAAALLVWFGAAQVKQGRARKAAAQALAESGAQAAEAEAAAAQAAGSAAAGMETGGTQAAGTQAVQPESAGTPAGTETGRKTDTNSDTKEANS